MSIMHEHKDQAGYKALMMFKALSASKPWVMVTSPQRTCEHPLSASQNNLLTPRCLHIKQWLFCSYM